MHSNRVSTNRGNTYLPPFALSPVPPQSAKSIWPNWDCANTVTGGDVEKNTASFGGYPACFTASPLVFQNRQQGRYTRIEAESYPGP